MRVYIDSDILIWHLRGNQNALHLMKQLSKNYPNALWIGAIQRAEIIFFMRPDEEKLTLMFLSQFKTAPVDQAIVDKAGEYYRKYNQSHGIDYNNAILAATLYQSGGILFTQNIKHFPMPELTIQKGW